MIRHYEIANQMLMGNTVEKFINICFNNCIQKVHSIPDRQKTMLTAPDVYTYTVQKIPKLAYEEVQINAPRLNPVFFRCLFPKHPARKQPRFQEAEKGNGILQIL